LQGNLAPAPFSSDWHDFQSAKPDLKCCSASTFADRCIARRPALSQLSTAGSAKPASVK